MSRSGENPAAPWCVNRASVGRSNANVVQSRANLALVVDRARRNLAVSEDLRISIGSRSYHGATAAHLVALLCPITESRIHRRSPANQQLPYERTLPDA